MATCKNGEGKGKHGDQRHPFQLGRLVEGELQIGNANEDRRKSSMSQWREPRCADQPDSENKTRETR